MSRLWAYGVRNRLLLEMGFTTYKDYLASPLWAIIREKAMRGRKCYACRGEAQVVHHVRYSREVLLGTDMNGLRAICHSCHTKIELDGNGEKRSLYQANKELKRLAGVPSKSRKNRTKNITLYFPNRPPSQRWRTKKKGNSKLGILYSNCQTCPGRCKLNSPQCKVCVSRGLELPQNSS